MGVLASNGMMSLDQQVPRVGPVPLARGRGRPRTEPSRAIIEILAVQWKRQMQLQGAGKDASRDLAAAILPTLAVDLKCALNSSCLTHSNQTLLPGAHPVFSAIFQAASVSASTLQKTLCLV